MTVARHFSQDFLCLQVPGFCFLPADLPISYYKILMGGHLQIMFEFPGVKGLLDEEEEAIKALDLTSRRCVVATGGSAVLREDSMKHLKNNGVCVYLNLPYTVISRRVKNRDTRGIAAENHETLKDIFKYRAPFYEKYADFTVDCKGKSVEKNVAEILRVLIGIE